MNYFRMDLKSCCADDLKSKEILQQYVIQLCKAINYNRMDDCIFNTMENGVIGLVQFCEKAFIVGSFNSNTQTATLYISTENEIVDICEATTNFTNDFFSSNETAIHISIK